MSPQEKKTLISLSHKDTLVEAIIETENLIIRPYREEDFDHCVTLYGDVKLTKYFNYGSPFSKEDVIDLIKKGTQFFKKGSLLGLFSIFEKSSLDFVGQCDIFPTDELNVVEIGCILNRKHHNKGYALECVKALLFDLVNEINREAELGMQTHIDKVIATVHPRNSPSKKLLEKLGMSFYKSEERYDSPRLWYSYNPRQQSTYSRSQFSPSWNPEQYHKHSSVQQVAAMALLKMVALSGNEEVLDVGCGDGKITAYLSTLAKNGHVLGIDTSERMIDFANITHKKNLYPNLEFELLDAEELDFEKRFDLIFSSFALQWLNKPERFFRSASKALRNGGMLVATIPLDVSSPLETAINSVIRSQRWSRYFIDILLCQLRGPLEYAALLKDHSFDLLFFSEITQEVIFENREEFEKYVLQWFPYLEFVPFSLRTIFFQEIIDKYFLLAPPLETQRILYKFQRLDFISRAHLQS